MTPGPWYVGEMLSPKAPAVIGDGDSVVAMLPGDWNGCSYIKADHRIIAAAPCLLAALQAINELAKGPTGGVTQAQKREVIDRAEAAITKATGETK